MRRVRPARPALPLQLPPPRSRAGETPACSCSLPAAQGVGRAGFSKRTLGAARARGRRGLGP